MSLADVNFSIRDKNVLYGKAQEPQTSQTTTTSFSGEVYTLNVCRNGMPATLEVYGPPGQES